MEPFSLKLFLPLPRHLVTHPSFCSLQPEKGKPTTLFPSDDICDSSLLFLLGDGCEGDNRQSLLFLPPHLSCLPSVLFLSTLSACITVSSPRLLPPPCPLAPSSLTLSSTYLWINNDNGLCSLKWEFCNQPCCVAQALMALIFSDLNAPQHHQRRCESTQINTSNKRAVNPDATVMKS